MSTPEPATPAPQPGQTRFTEVHGIRLETLHLPGASDRAPLVFLHEGLGSVSMWTQRGRCWPAELCAASGRAGWLYARRGYGRSDPVADVRGPSRWPEGWPGMRTDGPQDGQPDSAPDGQPDGPPDRVRGGGQVGGLDGRQVGGLDGGQVGGWIDRRSSGGFTGWPTGRHTPDYMHHEAAHVLPALWAAWGIERPVLVGHSDGATIALLHASAQRVSGCVLMAPHLFVEPVALAAIAQARDAFLAASGSAGGAGDAPGPSADTGFRQRLARHHADVDNAFWQWNDVWLSEAFRSFDIRSACCGIRDPVLAVQGHDDEYGTLAQLDALQQAVPHAQRLDLPACGHSPHRDQPGALTARVLRFLEDLP